MFLVGIAQWWYGAGWRQCLAGVLRGMRQTSDFFSVGLLFRTLFNPFRQIDAGGVQGGLSVQLNAYFSRLFSRCFGAVLRSLVILCGGLVLGVRAGLSIVWLIVWALLPIAPVIGFIVSLMGVKI